MDATNDIVVVMPNWVGDSIMAIPMLEALKSRFARERRLVGVMRPHIAELFDGEPWFDEVTPQDRQGRRGGLTFWQLVQHFRQRPPDMMFLLASSWRFAGLALLSGAKRRVGFRRNLRSWTLTHAVPFALRDEEGRPRTPIDQYLALAQAVGCEPETLTPRLGVTEEDDAGADLVWANVGFSPRQRVVMINPGGMEGTARNWAPSNFAALARRVVGKSPDLAVLVLCGPAERELADRVVAEANHPLIKSMARQDMRMGVTKAIVRRAALMVTGDHGLRHVAAAYATPTVCLEGPFDAAQNFSGNPDEVRVSVDLPCRPCNRHECPLGHRRCMTDLTVERVFASLERLLSPRPFLHVV